MIGRVKCVYIESISLGLTNNCNLNCSYCFEGKKNKLTMSVDTAKKSIDWLFRNDVSGPVSKVDISFFGGEPLLEMNTIKEIIIYAREKAELIGKEANFSATTNGVLFDKEIAEYWIENNLGILLSCDGIKKAHDISRKSQSGEGSFDLVEKNFDNVLSLNKGKEVRMTYTPHTCKYIADGVQYLSNCGFESISVFPSEEMKWTDQDLLACEESFYKTGEFLVNALEKNITLIINPISNRLKSLLNEDTKVLNNEMCGAGRTYVGIGVDGTIYPCHRFASHNNFSGAYPIGNIINGLDEIKRIPFLRMKKNLLLGCDIECDICSLHGNCTGGCMAANYDVTGHLTLRPRSLRFHEMIWDNVAKSMIDYFKENNYESFREKILGSKGM